MSLLPVFPSISALSHSRLTDRKCLNSQNIIDQTKANQEAAAQLALDGMKPTKASGNLPTIAMPPPAAPEAAGAAGKRRNRWDQTATQGPE